MVSVSVLIFLGWYFPTQMSQLKNTTVIYEWVIVGIIACVVGVVIFIRIRKSRIKETAAGEGHAEEDTVKEYNPINSGSCVEAILYSGYAKRGK